MCLVTRCSRCKVPFCGRECLKLAWPRHKLICSMSNANPSLDGPAPGEVVAIGNLQLRWGHSLGEMADSSTYLSDPALLRKAIETTGYALLRGVLPTEKIEAARSVVTAALKTEWKMLDSAFPAIEARIADNHKGLLLTGFRKVTHDSTVLALLEGPEIAGLFSKLFGEEPATFDNKWVRVMGHGESTDEHTDFYRFADTAKRMHTCWIPLGDYSVFQGTLAICEKSHLLEGFELQNYHETKGELPPGFEQFQRQAIWRSTHFRPGDIVIFDIRTVHASSKNQTRAFRISMDTRWQPASLLSSEARSCFRAFPSPST